MTNPMTQCAIAGIGQRDHFAGCDGVEDGGTGVVYGFGEVIAFVNRNIVCLPRVIRRRNPPHFRDGLGQVSHFSLHAGGNSR